MNYQKIYYQLIQKRKTELFEGYGEKHHIIPRCMGGSNEAENLVRLTAREHFIAHILLVKIYPKNKKLNYAVWRLLNDKRGRKVTSRQYEIARKNIASNNSCPEKRYKASIKLKGRKFDEAWKEKISIANSGRKLSNEHIERIREANLGRKLTDEHKEKLLLANLGSHKSDETKLKISEKAKNRKASEETKLKISNSQKGKIVSEETRRKLSIIAKERKYKIIICPHCGKEGANHNMKRFHFDNCKLKKETYEKER